MLLKNNIKSVKVIETENTLVFEVTSNNDEEITVKVGDTVIPKNTTDGKYRYVADAVGTFTITATVPETEFWSSGYNSTSFDVYKHSSDFDVIVSAADITVGQNATIKVQMNRSESGSVIIEINKANYTVPISGGIAEFNITLPVGTYSVRVFYNGDEKYNASNKTSDSFNVVGKNIAGINITDVMATVVDGKLVFTVKTNSTSELVVKVNGVKVDNVSDKYTYDADVVGKFTITAETLENDFWTAGFNSTTFEVIKHNSTVSVAVDPNHMVGDTFEITITNNTTAVVLINGITYGVIGGKVNVTTSELPAGEYIVVALTPENDKYLANNDSKSFNISKHPAEIGIVMDTIKVGEPAYINITLPSEATGKVLLDIGKHYYADVEEGVAKFNITGLDANEYDVAATYLGDYKYLDNSTAGKIHVEKSHISIEIVAQNITFGSTETVKIVTVENITGPVTVTINDINYTAILLNGEGNLTVDGLAAGEYGAYVIFDGNDVYSASHNETKFNVSKAIPDLDIVVENITYGQVEKIIVLSKSIVTLNITVGGVDYSELALNDGKFVLDISDLAAGEFEVKVISNENANYTSLTSSATFTVSKAVPTITVIADDIYYGETAEIFVDVSQAGNITLKLNGEKIESGSVLGLDAGKYTVDVTYGGSENYTQANATITFNVLKANTTVDIELVPSIVAGETQIINITLSNINASGEVIIYIGGEEYTASLTNGFANFTTPVLSGGNHTVMAIYDGDNKFIGNWTLKTFEVTKKSSGLIVNAQNITFGESERITVTVNGDAEGLVAITVNNSTYVAEINNGTATLELDNLDNGKYDVLVRYIGDDYYGESENSTEFTVSGKVTDLKVFDEGNGTVVVVVPSDATGNVTVEVNGKNYTAEIENGTATINLDDLTPGEYGLEVRYSGDENYLNASADVTVVIPKYETSMEVIVSDSNVGENATVVVKLPQNATGIVSIMVDGRNFTAEIEDSEATFVIDNLTSGMKTIVVDYYGDSNFTGNHTVAMMNISKVTPTIAVNASNVGEGEALIEITSPADITRLVLVTVDGTGYYVNMTDGFGNITVKNLSAGQHTLHAQYLGDDKYLNASDSTTK